MNTDVANVSRITTESKLVICVTVAVASLGYFVDVFDLIIFSIVRTASLKDLGIAGADSLSVGLTLLNWQLAGVLAGGILWGIIGDKRGRLKVLFGSIVVYSVANLVNAFVSTKEPYIACRFFAGLGLAGELGAGVTLVTEILSKSSKRGLGTMWIAGVGLLGAVFASYLSQHVGWRNIFIIGGIMGLILFVLRIGVHESRLFMDIESIPVRKGDIVHLFEKRERALRYLKCIFSDAHMYFVVGILLTGSPEIGRALNVEPLPTAGLVIGAAYLAMSLGDIVSSFVSQWLKSRKKALYIFHFTSLIAIVVFLYAPSPTAQAFLMKALFLGFSVGSWAVINVNAAEQFGTNLRALSATTVPNMIRALLIPMTVLFNALKGYIGILNGAAVVGIGSAVLAIVVLYFMDETYTKPLEWTEH